MRTGKATARRGGPSVHETLGIRHAARRFPTRSRSTPSHLWRSDGQIDAREFTNLMRAQINMYKLRAQANVCLLM